METKSAVGMAIKTMRETMVGVFNTSGNQCLVAPPGYGQRSAMAAAMALHPDRAYLVVCPPALQPVWFELISQLNEDLKVQFATPHGLRKSADALREHGYHAIAVDVGVSGQRTMEALDRVAEGGSWVWCRDVVIFQALPRLTWTITYID